MFFFFSVTHNQKPLILLVTDRVDEKKDVLLVNEFLVVLHFIFRCYFLVL